MPLPAIPRAAIPPIVLLMILLEPLAAEGQDRLTIWGTPPKEKPHLTKAAEGFPPLPLPVVPQRRTEKKRPPAPPKLLANLANFSFVGWQGSPGAVDQLLTNARKNLNVWYGWDQLDIRELARQHTSGIRNRTPILYLCAYYPLQLGPVQREALTEYVLAGGTLIVNCCGRQDAFDSVRDQLARMFPDHPLRRLPPDHPLFNAFYPIETVTYLPPSQNPLDAGAARKDLPRLRAVTLGTRAAVIVSYEDMACGWNEWNNPDVLRIAPADSTRIGLNLITYVTAEQRLARFLARTWEVAGPSLRPRQQVRFVQIVHDGNWNPNPSAVPLFLKELASNTSIAVAFDHLTMTVKDPKLFTHPLLYITGTWAPGLGEDETALLRRYLNSGGTLLADSAAGRLEFDRAFRELCERLFPDHPLQVLPPDHELYQCFHRIDRATLNHRPEPARPAIEAVLIQGRPVVLYSALGLGDGWAHQHSAYARCYTTQDALRLGTNLVVYAMQ